MSSETSYLNDMDKLKSLLVTLDYDENRMQEFIRNYTSDTARPVHNSDYSSARSRSIGIIGYGAMGRLYTKTLTDDKWHVNICDLPENYNSIEKELKEYSNKEFVTLFKDYITVIEKSDFIMFSTEAHIISVMLENIKDKSILKNKILGGQSSSKTIEVVNLLKHTQGLDTDIITLHSMHGPTVPTKGQSLAIIPVRLHDPRNLDFVDSFTNCFESNKKFLTFIAHDKTTANTQGLTHCAFINMGKAWYLIGKYPWLYDTNNTHPLEVFKVNLTFRIYGNNPHVYSNLAMMNPYSVNAIKVFSKNCEIINNMITTGQGDSLFEILTNAFKNVFGDFESENDSDHSATNNENTHLSLLALLKTWNDCGIDPIADKFLSTPLYKLLLSSVIRLFSHKDLLVIATRSTKYNEDDRKYVDSVKEYSHIIEAQDVDAFKDSFNKVVHYFQGDDMEAVKKKAQQMILELNE